MATVLSDRVVAPIPAEIVGRGLELIPVPAAQIVRNGERASVTHTNRCYRMAGLATVAEQERLLAMLEPWVARWLASDTLHEERDWTRGAGLEARHYRVTLARSSAGVRNRCIVTLLDQTARLNSERSLRREMKTDSLTGLPNREGFGEAVCDGGRRCAVLVIDLARFGRINACLGGLAGDELLITVARRVREALRAGDTLARIGGNEFGVLLTIDEHDDEAVALGLRIRQALAAPFRLTDYEIGVECAIGIAFGGRGEELEELLRQAQFATKHAKASSRIETYQNQAFAIVREQFGMETALRRAIAESRLRLAYQPICDMTTGAITSFEALCRWRDHDGRDISPVDFIPVAEETGLIVPLGRWVIDEAARTLAAWDAAAGGYCGVRLAINLSAIQLQRDAVPDLLRGTLMRHGLGGDRFTLELTESAVVSDPDRIVATMHALKATGATLAMDDFGTGYSNLSILQKLPIDVLKIDRSFVTGMLADRDKVAIVRTVLALASALGMRTTAEGVETVELSQTLAAMGCTWGQGYLYARPLEEDAALAMLLDPAG